MRAATTTAGVGGLVGLTDAAGAAAPAESVAAMAALAPARATPSVVAGRGGSVAAAAYGRRAAEARRDDITVWFFGEVRNREQARASLPDDPGARGTDADGRRERRARPQAELDAALLCALFAAGDWRRSLADLDGRFCAAAFDARRGVLHLTSDRLGDRHLFWTRQAGRLAWATTLGSLLAVPGFAPMVNGQALREFLRLDHLLGDRTWFEGVTLVPPGTVVTFDLSGRETGRHRYWWWDRIAVCQPPPDVRDAAEELERRVRAAVASSSGAGERVGVYLSGGLDSRLLLGAAADAGPVAALSFGVPDCMDVQIAREVCARRRVPHHVFDLTVDGWLPPRLAGVWATGGMVNLLHLHGLEAGPLARELFDAVLDGFGGDNTLRGDVLQHRRILDRFDRGFAVAYVGADESWLGDLSAYAGLGRTEYIHLENRARRLWSATADADEDFVTVRRPLVANAVVEFVYSLPDTVRYRGKLYRALLLSAFPDLFRDIPWAATGVPISWPRGSARLYWYRRRLEQRLTGTVSAVGLPRRGPAHYADYASWVRAEPARSFIERLILGDDALSREYLPARAAGALWQDMARGRDRSLEVCRVLTLEVWLRQVFTGEFRPAP